MIISIGDRTLEVSAKTAELIKVRQKALAVKGRQTVSELNEARLLPHSKAVNSRHASFIAEAFTVRVRSIDTQTVVRASKTAHTMGLTQEWGELCRKTERRLM